MLSINIERIWVNSKLKFIEQKHYAKKITAEFWNTKKTVSLILRHTKHMRERERETERETDRQRQRQTETETEQ